MNNRRIGIDLMGSEQAPLALLSAIATAVPTFPSDVRLSIIATPDLKKAVETRGLIFVPAQVVQGKESARFLFRKKNHSSYCIGLSLLQENKLDALVSATDTSELVRGAKIILGTIPSFHRPALLALMPTKKKNVAVLDVGANIQIKTNQLIQFAQLGAAYQKTRGIETPRIGILNIGSESFKGTEELQTTYKRLEQSALFAGNVEGRSVFDGEIDVLVTDGFTGNVFLKTAEGVANLIFDRLRNRLPPKEFEEIQSEFNDLQNKEHSWALLCGVNGIVIKCHGYATPEMFLYGILGAIELTKSRFIEALRYHLSRLTF